MKREPGFVTNNFLSATELGTISKQSESELYFNTAAIAVIYRDNSVSRLYFYLSSIDSVWSLKNLIKVSKQRPLVVDCVGKGEKLEQLANALSKSGFVPYKRMSRWRGDRIRFFPELAKQKKIFFRACEKHLEGIAKLLVENFDPFVSHLPDSKKLSHLIKDGLVFCAAEEIEVQAVACLEKVGKRGIYLYQYAVATGCRQIQMGSAIFQYALHQFPECSNFTSWTTDDNTPSNRIHEKFGLYRDGLKDIILLYQ